tara:strand:- start:26 stop:712 length:687 start_codon:yes stop_codon:yes gene_type:complete
MKKIYKIAIKIFVLLIISSPLEAHVQHYENLNSIEFEIHRNGKNIGKHIFSFKKDEDQLIVYSEINFEIKKLGVLLYKYHVKGTEIYKNGNLVKFNSKTLQNKKSKYVNLDLKDSDFIIDGSSFKGKVPNDYILGTWWNHSIVKSKAQISAVSGRIINQKVTFLGKENLNINGKKYKSLHFNFSSTDKSLKKNKKLDTDVWYDEESLNWIKASFNKKGQWEYKLINIK